MFCYKKRLQLTIIPILFLYYRSAPASPNHLGVAGSMTPDSLSREPSPIPEVPSSEYIVGESVVGRIDQSTLSRLQTTPVEAAKLSQPSSESPSSESQHSSFGFLRVLF